MEGSEFSGGLNSTGERRAIIFMAPGMASSRGVEVWQTANTLGATFCPTFHFEAHRATTDGQTGPAGRQWEHASTHRGPMSSPK